MQPTPAVDIFKIFAEDKQMILYRPTWRKITGNVTATILLQQILFYWNRNGRTPFFKFKEPCKDKENGKNPLYKAGDSWVEELGFGRREFDTAIKKIGQKISQKRLKTTPELKQHTKPVEWWTDEKHITWYTIHEANLIKLLTILYPSTENCCEIEGCPRKRDLYFRRNTNRTSGEVQTVLQEKRAARDSQGAERTLDLKCAARDSQSTERTLDLDQRDLPEKRSSAESALAPALAIYRTHFPDITLTPYQQKEIVATAANLPAWEYTCAWFHLQAYPGKNKIGNFLDFYAKQARPRFSEPQPQPPPAPGSEWEQILKQLALRLNRPGFNTWIRPLHAPICRNGTVTVPVRDEVFQHWLKEYYTGVFQAAYTTVRGETPEIEFVIQPEVYA